MSFLLDSNVFVHLGNQSRGWENIQDQIRRHGVNICAMSAMTAFELRYLLQRGPGRVKKDNIARLEHAFRSFANVLPVTGAVAERAAVLRAELQSTGVDIGVADCIIAAQALDAGRICITANRKHFNRVPGLIVADWSSGDNPV